MTQQEQNLHVDHPFWKAWNDTYVIAPFAQFPTDSNSIIFMYRLENKKTGECRTFEDVQGIIKVLDQFKNEFEKELELILLG